MGTWRDFWDGLALDFEVLALFALLAGLCLWFAAAEPSERLPRFAPPAFNAATIMPPRPKAAPFTFVSATARNHLRPALAWAGITGGRAAAALQGRPSHPVMTAAIERHAILPEPGADPLGALMVHGLPEEAVFSAGARFSDSTRAVAFADLDGLIITLPPRGNAPLRTTLDLMSRSGVVIHSFDVELREAAPKVAADRPAPNQNAPRQKKRKALPAKDARSKAKTIENVATVTPPKPPPGAVKQAAPAPPPVTAALLPLGFFNPDPKDSTQSGLNPDLRDDPRFTTLRGLGMQPLAAPVPPAP